jgi:hypothetical protein
MMKRYIVMLMCFCVTTMQCIVIILVYHSIIVNDAIPFNVFVCCWMIGDNVVWYKDISSKLVGYDAVSYTITCVGLLLDA